PVLLRSKLLGPSMCHHPENQNRDIAHSSGYDDPWTGFTVAMNTCYANYQYPFPPYECTHDQARFRNEAECYNIDWLTWEKYGRTEISEESTRYLFWQWNDRLNRHYILANLACGAAWTGDYDRDGVSIPPEVRTIWRQRCREMLADWLYDFPEAVSGADWGDEAFTVHGDVTQAVRTTQWWKMLQVLNQDRLALPPWLMLDCLKLLFLQGQLHADSLPVNWKPNNHMAMLAFSLYSTGLFYPEFYGGGQAWRQTGIEAVRGLCYPDGGAKEGSTQYQTLSLDFINHFFDLAEYNDPENSQGLLDELSVLKSDRLAMHLYLWGIADTASGLRDKHLADNDELYAPAINDGVGTGVEISRFADRLLDITGSDSLPVQSSTFFPDSGQMVLVADTPGYPIYLLFDAGPFGGGAHGHQDKLSFVLSAYGCKLLGDPGGWGGSNLNWDRTAMHTSITVDDYGQVRPYLDSYTTNAADNRVSLGTDYDRIESIYDQGFGVIIDNEPNYRASVTHHRQLEFFKTADPPYFMLIDTLSSSAGEHHIYKVYFHFDPAEARLERDLIIDNHLLTTKQGHLAIQCLSQNGQWLTENRLITNSYTYGNVTPAAAAYYQVFSRSGDTEIVFLLTPHPN
ncbi:alginate lyase family protein, partial [bacterium]|nr:alginate lyase family protein [bacterium]